MGYMDAIAYLASATALRRWYSDAMVTFVPCWLEV